MLTDESIALLRRVQDYILAEPRRLDMDLIATRGMGRYNEDWKPPCGTAGCIAGWAAILARFDEQELVDVSSLAITIDGETHGFDDQPYTFNDYITRLDWDDGERVLGLDNEQAHRLFTQPGSSGCWVWPNDLAERYLEADTPLLRAQVAAERIDRFIASGGEV